VSAKPRVANGMRGWCCLTYDILSREYECHVCAQTKEGVVLFSLVHSSNLVREPPKEKTGLLSLSSRWYTIIQ
jgi:hypothetical protein